MENYTYYCNYMDYINLSVRTNFNRFRSNSRLVYFMCEKYTKRNLYFDIFTINIKMTIAQFCNKIKEIEFNVTSSLLLHRLLFT